VGLIFYKFDIILELGVLVLVLGVSNLTLEFQFVSVCLFCGLAVKPTSRPGLQYTVANARHTVFRLPSALFVNSETFLRRCGFISRLRDLVAGLWVEAVFFVFALLFFMAPILACGVLFG
jgi:hypothetical protein